MHYKQLLSFFLITFSLTFSLHTNIVHHETNPQVIYNDGTTFFSFDYDTNIWTLTTSSSSGAYASNTWDGEHSGSVSLDNEWQRTDYTNGTLQRDTWSHTSTPKAGDTHTKASVFYYNCADNTWQSRHYEDQFSTDELVPEHFTDTVSWNYNATTNRWRNLSTGKEWTYDFELWRWHNVTGELEQWDYRHTTNKGWNWVHTDGINDANDNPGDTIAFLDSSNGWQDITHNILWKIISDNTIYRWTGTTGYVPYILYPNDRLWYANGNIHGTTGIRIFSFFPPPLAAELAFITQKSQGYLAANFPTEIAALATTAQNTKDSLETEAAAHSNAIPEEELAPLTTALAAVKADTQSLLSQYINLMNPLFDPEKTTKPTGSASFEFWNTTSWRMLEQGKLFCSFETTGSTAFFVGITKDIPTSASPDPDFYIFIHTTSGADIYADSTKIAESGAFPNILSTSVWKRLWLEYDDGVISVGTGDASPFSGSITKKDTTLYTVDLNAIDFNATVKSRITEQRFFSFTDNTGATTSFRNIVAIPTGVQQSLASIEMLTAQADTIVAGLDDPSDLFTESAAAVDAQITALSSIAADATMSERYAAVEQARKTLESAIQTATTNRDAVVDDVELVDDYNALISRAQAIKNIATNYGLRFKHHVHTKALLDHIHMMQIAQEDSSAFTAYMAIAQTNLAVPLASAATILSSSHTGATSAQGLDGNSGISGWVTQLNEEHATVQAQQAALEYWEAEMLARHEALHSTPGSAATAATAARSALATTLGTDLANGDTTFYAIITGIMRLISRNTFDQTDTQVASTLATLAASTDGLEKSDFHTFASTYYNNASSNATAIINALDSLQAYLDDQDRSLSVSPSTLTSQDSRGTIVYNFGQDGDTPSWTWTTDDTDFSFTTAYWKDDIAFGHGGESPAYSERWESDTHHAAYGRLWTNTSARPAADPPVTQNSAFMYHNLVRDRWMQYDPVGGDTSGPTWKFEPLQGLWHQIDTDTYWYHDPQALTWQNASVPTQKWSYQYDTTYGWEWYNHDTEQGWQYRSTDEHWHINGDPDTSYTITTPTTLRNQTAAQDYSFASGTGLWHLDGDTNNTGLQLFPFFPPNPAAQIALINDRGFTFAYAGGIENVAAPGTIETATTTFETTLSTEHNNTPTDEEFATARAPLDTLITNYTDELADWYHTHTHLLMPDAETQNTVLSGLSTTFDYWSSTAWRLLGLGNGLIIFKVRGATSGLKVGFSQKIPNAGVADYSLELDPSTEQAATYTNATSLNTGSIDANLYTTDEWSEVWIRYTAGVISCGAVIDNILQPAQYSFDITLFDVEDLFRGARSLAPSTQSATSVCYFSFADTDTGNLEIKDIRSLPVTALTDTASVITAKKALTDAQARQADQANLVPIRTAVLAAHTPLLTLIDESRLIERTDILEDANDALAAAAASAAAIDPEEYSLSSSETALNDLITHMTAAQAVHNDFIAHVITLPTLKRSLNALHEAVVTSSSAVAFEAEVDTYQAAVDATLTTHQSTLVDIVTSATAVYSTNGYRHLAPWTNTFKEEKAVVDVQKAALTYVREVLNKESEDRFASPGDLSAFSPDNEKTILTTTLGAQVVSGDITFFAAITGIMTLLSKESFDDTRDQVTATLAALAAATDGLEVSDFHTFGGNYYTDASATKTAIESALTSLQDYLDAQEVKLEIPTGTTELHASNGAQTVEYNYITNSWGWSVDSYTATFASNVWKDGTAFTPGGGIPSYSEKWDLTTATGDTALGYTWSDASATLKEGNTATIHHNTASQLWKHHATNGPTWLYDEDTHQWRNTTTDAFWMFDHATLTWHNTQNPEERWQYQYDATLGWQWYDHQTENGWQYRSDNKWHNSGDSTSWTVTNAATIHNVGDDTNYQFDSGTGLWHLDGNTGNAGIKMFPFFPPTPATHIAYLKERGRTYLAHLGDTDVVAKNTALASAQENLDAAFSNYNGVVPTATSDPLEIEFNTCKGVVNAVPATYRNLIDPLVDITHIASLPAAATFSAWKPAPIWALSKTGNGFCKFQIKGSGVLTLGLSTTTHTGTQVEFTITLDGSGTSASAWYGGNIDTPLNTQTITDFLPDGADSWHDVWFSYNDGVFLFGTGTLSEVTQTITDKTTIYSVDLSSLSFDSSYKNKLDDVTFFALAGPTDGTFEVRNISVLPTTTNTALETLMHTTLPAAQDALDNVLDGQQLGEVHASYVAIQDDLVAIADVISCVTRSELAAAANTALEALHSDAIALRDADPATLAQEASFTTLNTYISCINTTEAANDGYITYKNALSQLQTLRNTVGKQLETETDAAVFTTFLSTLKSSLSTELTAIKTPGVDSMISGAQTVLAAPCNSNVGGWVTMLKEEQALVNMQILALDFFEKHINRKYETLRFSRDDSRTITEKKESLNAAITEYNATRDFLVTSLATKLAAGNITLYSAVAAPLLLIVNKQFDTIRTDVQNYYSALAEDDSSFTLSDIHAFASDVSSPYFGKVEENKTNINNALDALTTSLEGTIEKLLLTEDPGTDKSPAPTVAQILEDEDVVVETIFEAANTEELENQSLVASAGATEEEKTVVVVQPRATAAVKVDVDDAGLTREEAQTDFYLAESATVPIGQSYITDTEKAVTVSGPISFKPDANGYLPLSSDVYVMPNNSGSPVATPFVAGTSFGTDTRTRCVGTTPLAQQGKHRIEFYSEGTPRNIIVRRNTELNLTSFGKGDVAFGQRIVFGDDVSLVLEPGATIRLPYLEPSLKDRAPIIEFSGKNSRLVFLEDQVETQERWSSVTNGPDAIRNKILGVGTIRFSGENARMEILHDAMVSIESDYTSPRTDLIFEFSGTNAQLCIGTPSTPGGALQIGNPLYGGYNRNDTDNYPNNSTHPRVPDIDNLDELDPFTPITTQIDCAIILSGNNAQVHIGRNGFLGIGVGVLNKQGNPNGSTPDADTDLATDDSQFNAWRTHSLYNVTSFKCDLQRGALHHHSIGNGSANAGSCIAVGPLHELGGYQLTMNRQLSKIYGGGNVVFVREIHLNQTGTASVAERAKGVDDTITLDEPLPLRIWDTAHNTSGNKATDNGAYSLLAPDQLIRRYVPKHTSATVQNTGTTYTFTGGADEFYRMLTLQGYKSEDQFYTVLHNVLGSLSVSYVRDDMAIVTKTISAADILDTTDLSTSQLVAQGALLGSQNYSHTVGGQAVLDPITFKPE